MKGFILLLAAAIAAGSYPGRYSGYQPGTEYRYVYESQVITGVPHFAVQYAGMKIKAQIRAQIKSDQRVVLQLENVMLHKIKTELEQPGAESELLPDSQCETFDALVTDQITKELRKPVTFDLQNGKVHNLKVDSSEKTWSVDIKKAIVSLFQVGITRQDSEERQDLQAWRDDIPDRYEDILTMNTGSIHKQMETDVIGECETLYSVNKDSQKPGSLKVHKIKNFDNCRKQLRFEQGMISGLTIKPEALDTKNMIEKSMQATYDLEGQQTTFKIRSVRQDSKYIFTPTSQKYGSTVTSMIQKMVLTDEKPVSRSIDTNMQMRGCKNGLMYEFPYSAMQHHREYDMGFDNPMSGRGELSGSEKKEMVEQMLSEIVGEVHPALSKSAVQKVKSLTKIMNTMSTKDLIDLCERYTTQGAGEQSREWDDQSEKSRKREVLLDILPTLTTPKSLKTLGKLICDSRISTVRASLSLKASALTVTPDLELMEYILPNNRDFMACEVMKRNPILRRAALTAVPTIIRRFIKSARNEGYELRDILPELERFTSQIKESYSDCDEESQDYEGYNGYNQEYEGHNNYNQGNGRNQWNSRVNSKCSPSHKIAVLKGIKNSGLPTLIPFVAEIVLNKNEDPLVRTVAAQSFKKMPKTFSKRIQKILASAYIDLTDENSLRKSAFIALMDQRPESDILNLVTRVHRKERSVQVGSFVYSYLSTLASAQLPGLRNLTQNIRKVLPLIRPVAPTSFSISKAMHFDHYSKESRWGIGDATMTFDDTKIPSVWISKVMLNLFGQTFSPLEVDIWGTGITKTLSKMFGIHSNFRQESFADKEFSKVIDELLTPLKSGHVEFGSVAEEMKQIIQKLGLVDRPTLERMSMGLNLNILGQDMGLSLSAKNLLQWARSGKMPVLGEITKLISELSGSGKTIDCLKVLSLPASTLQLPTPIGLPLSLNLTTTVIVHTIGHAKINTPSTWASIYSSWTQRTPMEMTLETTLKPSMSIETKAEFGVDCGPVKSGVAVIGRAHGSMSTRIKFNVASNSGRYSANMKWYSQQGEGDLFTAQVDPMVFVSTRSSQKSINPTTYDTMRLSHPKRIEIVEVKVPIDLSSVNTKLMTTVRVPVAQPSWMSNSYIWSPCGISIRSSPQNPSEPLVFKIESTRSDNIRSHLPSSYDYISQNTQGTKTTVTIGPEGSMRQGHFFVFATQQHPRTFYMVASMSDNQHIGELSFNVDGFNTQKFSQMNPSTSVLKFKVSCRGQQVTYEMFPHNEPIRWNMEERNNFFVLLESFTREPITSSIVRPVTKTTPELRYKVRVHTNVDYERLPIGYKSLVAFYLAYGKPSMLLQSLYTRNQNGASEIQGQMTITPSEQKMIVSLRTPSTTFSINLPYYLFTPYYKLITVESPMSVSGQIESQDAFSPRHQWGSEWGQHYGSGRCSIYKSSERSQEIVSTFDSLSYSIPSLPSSCEVLLAKDCTSQSLFTVLMNTNGDSKKLKIFVPKYKIEVEPVSGWLSSGKVRVTVNGEEKDISGGNSMYLQDRLSRSSSIDGEIIKGDRWAKVLLKKYGLTVSTDGKHIMIETSRYMANHVCGICGNYDSEIDNEYEGPDMYVYPSEKVMVSKYVVPSGSCSPQSVRSHFGVTEIPAESCRPRQHTVVKYVRDETCFSTSPQYICPSSCENAGSSTHKRVGFRCHPSNSLAAKELVQQAQEGVVRSLEYQRVDEELQVAVPERCTPRY